MQKYAYLHTFIYAKLCDFFFLNLYIRLSDTIQLFYLFIYLLAYLMTFNTFFRVKIIFHSIYGIYVIELLFFFFEGVNMRRRFN